MRILLFNLATDADDPLLGFTTRWISALAKRVDYVHVITMRAGRVVVPENVRVWSVGKEKGYGEPRRAVEFYKHLFRVLREDDVDACFSHMIPVFTVLAAPILRPRGIPIVTWYGHRQVTRTLKLAHHLSNTMISSAPTSYCYKHDKLVVVGQGIDTQLFSPADFQPDYPPLLLSVGRISPIKDLITLVEAVHLLRQRGHVVRCALVGDAPERDRAYAERVKSEVVRLGLTCAVDFVGAVPQEQTVHWYRRSFAHVNLCPTGALDKAALEAMACGRPSLVANEGFRETLGPWAGEMLFRHRDSEDLAQRVEQLLRMPNDDRLALCAGLRRTVVDLHSLDQLMGRLIGIFGEACN